VVDCQGPSVHHEVSSTASRNVQYVSSKGWAWRVGGEKKKALLASEDAPKGRTETGASLTCRIIAVGHACRNCFAEMRKTMRGIFSADIEPAEPFLDVIIDICWSFSSVDCRNKLQRPECDMHQLITHQSRVESLSLLQNQNDEPTFQH